MKLSPSQFNNSRIHYYEYTASTMDIARQLARDQCPDGTVVIASIQSKGRGRMQRNWESQKGGLYMTRVIRPTLDISLCFAYTFAAALAIVHTLQHEYKIVAHVKWPNDILVKGRKIAGILTETAFQENRLTYLNMGMGINVNNQTDHYEFQAVSVQEILHETVDLNCFFTILDQALNQKLKIINVDQILEEWKIHNCTLGKDVRIVTPSSIIEGLAVGLNSEGALLIEKNNGSIETILYGDCVPHFKCSY